MCVCVCGGGGGGGGGGRERGCGKEKMKPRKQYCCIRRMERLNKTESFGMFIVSKSNFLVFLFYNVNSDWLTFTLTQSNLSVPRHVLL